MLQEFEELQKLQELSKDFVLMSQKSRQNAKISIEMKFFKQLIIPNFLSEILNHFYDCTFDPISNKFAEIYYINKILQFI